MQCTPCAHGHLVQPLLNYFDHLFILSMIFSGQTTQPELSSELGFSPTGITPLTGDSVSRLPSVDSMMYYICILHPSGRRGRGSNISMASAQVLRVEQLVNRGRQDSFCQGIRICSESATYMCTWLLLYHNWLLLYQTLPAYSLINDCASDCFGIIRSRSQLDGWQAFCVLCSTFSESEWYAVGSVSTYLDWSLSVAVTSATARRVMSIHSMTGHGTLTDSRWRKSTVRWSWETRIPGLLCFSAYV